MGIGVSRNSLLGPAQQRGRNGRLLNTTMRVILAAHGAGDGSEANRGLLELARTLRVLRPGVSFECAFWKGTPSFERSARRLRGQHPVVVPIMTSDGYYARRRLPEEWAKGDPSLSWTITAPIGTQQAFRRVLAAKVGRAVEDMNRRVGDTVIFGGTLPNPVVLIVGHGTTRVRSSGDAARRARDELALAFPGTQILAAFLDESPRLVDVAASLSDRPVVAVPFLLGGGPHVLVDLAAALTAPRTASGIGRVTAPLTILPPILEWAELASLALGAVDTVANTRPVRRPMLSLPNQGRSPVLVGAGSSSIP